MSDFVVNKAGLPFLLGGATGLAVRIGSLNPLEPLPNTAGVVFDVSANGTARDPVDIGGAGSCTVSLAAGTHATLRVARPGSQPANDYALTPFFAKHPDYLALLLDVGANANGTCDAGVGYAGLSATATLQAGTQARFVYVNAYPKATAVKDLLPAFLCRVRVPALVSDTPGPGEVSRLEFGGTLKLGLQVGAGYAIKGAPSFDLGALHLSERYDLSVIGTVGLSAEVAGLFSIEVRAATDAGGNRIDDWARVIVKRSRSDRFAIAGDVKVHATSALKGLPESPDEFLGALLGVNVKSWLHVFERVATLTDPAQLKTEIDALARQFIGEWTGETLHTLDRAGLGRVLARVKIAVDQYRGLENTVISAFDRYFNQLTSPALGGRIAKAIESVANLPSWDSLHGDVDPLVWRIVTELTDGDPLGWILTKEVARLQARASALLALVSSRAHAELREVIALVKQRFGLDPLFSELDKLDTIAKLQAQANTRAGAFVHRLTGQVIDGLDQGKAAALLDRLHRVLTSARSFEKTAYAKFTAALSQTASLALHAEYSRAATDDAFVDVAINLGTAEGRRLLQACALGDFTDALGGNRRDLVRVNEGRLVHRIVKQRTVGVTVAGWQKAFSYSAVDQLIVEADQRLVTEANGGVTAYTTLSLEKVRDRKRNGERTLTNLMLQFAGESAGVLEASDDDRQFLVDAIAGMSARYQLSYSDDRTSAGELARYAAFANGIGIDVPALATLLTPVSPGDFGPVTAAYDVRYSQQGLVDAFRCPFNEAAIRDTMRKVILTSYLQRGAELASVGWACWTCGVYDLWKAGQGAFVKTGPQVYSPIRPSPFTGTAAPASVQIGPERQSLLSTLYYVEDDFVAGLRALTDLIGRGARIPPADFARALGRVGSALDRIDRFAESENGAFAVLDELQRRAAPGSVRQSSLTITSRLGGQPVTKVFLPAAGPNQVS